MNDVYKPAFTERLRSRVQAVIGVCPTCGQGMNTPTRDLAEQVGTSNTTMWRFLNGGRPNADLVDKIVDWLDEHEPVA